MNSLRGAYEQRAPRIFDRVLALEVDDLATSLTPEERTLLEELRDLQRARSERLETFQAQARGHEPFAGLERMELALRRADTYAAIAAILAWDDGQANVGADSLRRAFDD